MPMHEMLLPEFDQEMANTRKTLERVPENKFDFKPHPKSGSMIWLAAHVATIPTWCAVTIRDDSFDVAPNGVQMQPPPPPKTSKELLQTFDKGVAEARQALAGASDAVLLKQWSLLSNKQTLFAMPRITAIRSFVMNHMIHHRAQLGVYLRLNNLPVPAIYGPSADEGGM
jgi:uncharacterized damage-inducible protein DinB